MTHDELVARAVRWLRGRAKCYVVFAEITTSAGTIPDALGFNAGGGSVLIECKTSLADFRRDGKKLAHRLPKWFALGDVRWYMAPPGVVPELELPDDWGLLEVYARQVRVKVPAPPVIRTHRQERRERQLLISACRRHQLAVPWFQDSAKFEPYSKHRSRRRRRRRR